MHLDLSPHGYNLERNPQILTAATAVFASHGISTTGAQTVTMSAQEYNIPQPLAAVKNRAAVRAIAIWTNGQNPISLRPLAPRTRPPRVIDDGRVKPKLPYFTNATTIGGTILIAAKEAWEARLPILTTPDTPIGQALYDNHWIFWLIEDNTMEMGASMHQEDAPLRPSTHQGMTTTHRPPSPRTSRARIRIHQTTVEAETSTTENSMWSIMAVHLTRVHQHLRKLR